MKYYIADAFTDEIFHGNQAGVCLLDEEISDELMQKIAAENNLSETAFLLKKDGEFLLRWFTPDVEIDLCGHATLATAFVLMTELEPERTSVSFSTMSGVLNVERDGELFRMTFPSRPPKLVESIPILEKALGCKVLETTLSRDLVVLTDSEKAVAELAPDIEMIKQISSDIALAVVVTAKGESCDFVSRFFAPNAGIVEDPVTGSSHCTLIPYWRKKLGRDKMTARQLSARGGQLECEYLGDKVAISGKVKIFMRGEITLGGLL